MVINGERTIRLKPKCKIYLLIDSFIRRFTKHNLYHLGFLLINTRFAQSLSLSLHKRINKGKFEHVINLDFIKEKPIQQR